MITPKEVVLEFAERLIRYYDALGGSTYSALVSYHIRQIVEEMFKEDETDAGKEN